MDNIYAIIFIITPISLFGAGFLVARQLRGLENVPLFSMVFIQRRLLFSVVTGFFISLIFMVILSLVNGFTSQLFFSFFGIFLLATFSYYFGVNNGWGNSVSSDKSTTISITQTSIDTGFPENIQVENSLDSVKITINSKKRWGLFAIEAFQLIVIGLCALPILSLVIISLLQNYLPQSFRFLVWLLAGGLALYLFYTKAMEALEYIFDKEVVEINNLSVRVEKYVSQFSSKKEYPAESIKKITAMFSLGSTNLVLKRLPFLNSNLPAFVMWHNRGLKRYHTFGREIDLADAQRILEIVYSKFPQYKG
jgi:hypothetical protein